MSKKVFVKDIKGSGLEIVEEIFAIDNIQRHKTRTGNPFYRVALKDKTGIIQARIWQDYFRFCSVEELNIGDVVKVNFYTEDYNNQTQVIVTKMQKTEEYNMADLIVASDKPIDKMLEQLDNYIQSIKDKDLQKLLKAVFNDAKIRKAFQTLPAGTIVHHNFVGGLLDHTLEVTDLALSMQKHYPLANRDLVIAGSLLHDIGKIFEYKEEKTGFSPNKELYLIGHIVMAVNLIEKLWPQNANIETKLQLEHIILSHHTELEYGAVVKPATLEASIVALADLASTRVRQYFTDTQKAMESKTHLAEYNKYLGATVYSPDRQINNSSTLDIENSISKDNLNKFVKNKPTESTKAKQDTSMSTNTDEQPSLI